MLSAGRPVDGTVIASRLRQVSVAHLVRRELLARDAAARVAGAAVAAHRTRHQGEGRDGGSASDEERATSRRRAVRGRVGGVGI